MRRPATLPAILIVCALPLLAGCTAPPETPGRPRMGQAWARKMIDPAYLAQETAELTQGIKRLLGSEFDRLPGRAR